MRKYSSLCGCVDCERWVWTWGVGVSVGSGCECGKWMWVWGVGVSAGTDWVWGVGECECGDWLSGSGCECGEWLWVWEWVWVWRVTVSVGTDSVWGMNVTTGVSVLGWDCILYYGTTVNSPLGSPVKALLEVKDWGLNWFTLKTNGTRSRWAQCALSGVQTFWIPVAFGSSALLTTLLQYLRHHNRLGHILQCTHQWLHYNLHLLRVYWLHHDCTHQSAPVPPTSVYCIS